MAPLFDLCPRECASRPGARRGGVRPGGEAPRLFFREQRNAGADIKVSAYSFRQKEDSVEVLGWIRLLGADGVMADSQGRWTYRFRDGQIVEADYSPATVAAA